jgi:hypothetical protein
MISFFLFFSVCEFCCILAAYILQIIKLIIGYKCAKTEPERNFLCAERLFIGTFFFHSG